MIIKIYWTCWTVNVELDVGYIKKILLCFWRYFLYGFLFFLVCECLNSDCMACCCFFVSFILFLCLPFHDFYLSGREQVWLKPRPLLSLVHSLWYWQRNSFKCPQTSSRCGGQLCGFHLLFEMEDTGYIDKVCLDIVGIVAKTAGG